MPTPAELLADADRHRALVAEYASTPAPVDCVLSAWGPWSAWSTCVGGQQSRTRTRTIVTPPSNGGAACGPLTETETQACTVTPPANTQLGQIAAGMAPGTWAQITVPNQNAILGVGNSTGSAIPYCNAMPWNPINKCIEIIGTDHGMAPRHVRFNAITHLFELVDVSDPLLNGHGYDHLACDPLTGTLYWRNYGSALPIQISRKKLTESAFVALAGLPSWYTQVAIGTCWWSGAFNGGDPDGNFMVYNSGTSAGNANDGQIGAYNPKTNTWFWDKHGASPFFATGSTYHSVMAYSAVKNCAVYGGGSGTPDGYKKLWRLKGDRTIVAMPNVPDGKRVGVQNGLLVEEPVTGNFLLLSSKQLWELNPDGSGTWTQQTGARTPPASVGTPNAPELDGMFACPIPEYGVVAYVKQKNTTTGAFWLYKHGA